MTMTVAELRMQRFALQRTIDNTEKAIERLNLTAEIGLASRMVPSLQRKLARARAELAALPVEAASIEAQSPRLPTLAPLELLPKLGDDPLDIPLFLRRTP